MTRLGLTAMGMLALGASAAAQAPNPAVRADDVERFFEIYDSTGATPDAGILQQEYLDRGSEGLTRFAELRRITGDSIAAAIVKDPQLYVRARECAKLLPPVLESAGSAAERLRELIPSANVPVITIAVGRGRPVAVGEARGAYIGLEALCAWTTPDPDFERRAYHVIMHELVHTQQTGLAETTADPTVLHASLVEGAAEFVTELLTGSVAYRHLANAMNGREEAFERAFLDDIDKPAVGSRWVFNSGAETDEPSDLGYRIGYRIAKSHYQNADDKGAAIREIIGISDAHEFLAESGWQPGAVLR